MVVWMVQGAPDILSTVGKYCNLLSYGGTCTVFKCDVIRENESEPANIDLRYRQTKGKMSSLLVSLELTNKLSRGCLQYVAFKMPNMTTWKIIVTYVTQHELMRLFEGDIKTDILNSTYCLFNI